ncbi:MAG: FadR family transcriptional regulator [Chloroflexi bacterium]|nr:FadR family transcriptional regulator [Chloroflexota bacterium]
MVVPTFGRLSPIRLSESIADRIESMILDNQLRPDDKLPSERELALQFGVSRTAVREAIKLLEQRGLLEPRNGRGAFVTMPGPNAVSSSLNVVYRMQGWTIDNLHEARWCLECFVVSLAAQRATPEDIARMEEAINTMDRSLDEDDPNRYMQADGEFHAALAGATQNPLFLTMIRPLVDLIQDVGRAEFFHGRIRERHQNHKGLLECVRLRDAPSAEAVMRRHLTETRQMFEAIHPQQS